MKPLYCILLILAFHSVRTEAQNQKCATMKNWAKIIAQDPAAESRKEQLNIITQKWIGENSGTKNASVVTIPVVVHVLYNTETENISDDQIYSQLNALNQDFRLQNADSLLPNHPFWPYTADCGIEFCLAQQDPNGNPTNGITRTYTDVMGFDGEGDVKFSNWGGTDNWNPHNYLNIWVCNLYDQSGGTLGYASFPSDLTTYPDEDGVVIDYRAFGNVGAAGTGGLDVNDLGRTATHEVGHWLNLYHIWGDDTCGDDQVDDTPAQEADNAGCPQFPYNAFNSCGSDGNGEMYMNYMDYVDDACMVMFTFGQNDRMQAALNNARASLLSSPGCIDPTGIAEVNPPHLELTLFPNPNNGMFFASLSGINLTTVRISVTDILGNMIFENEGVNASSEQNFKIELGNQSNGVYFLSVETDGKTWNKKIIIQQ